MSRLSKKLFVSSLPLIVGSCHPQGRETFKKQSYTTVPYLPRTLAMPAQNRVMLLSPAWHLVVPRPLEATRWDGVRLGASQTPVDPIASRESALLFNAESFQVHASDEICGQADQVMAWLSAALGLPLSGVSVVGDFSIEGPLVCNSLEEALRQRQSRGARIIYVPKTIQPTVAGDIRVASNLRTIVAELGGPNLGQPSRREPPRQDPSLISALALTKSNELEEALRPSWAQLIEFNNGAGLGKAEARAAKKATSRVKHAQRLNQEGQHLAALMMWDQATRAFRLASNIPHPVPVSVSSSHQPSDPRATTAKRLLALWYPNNFTSWKSLIFEHIVSRASAESESVSFSLSDDAIDKLFASLAIHVNVSSNPTLSGSTARAHARAAIMRAEAISGVSSHLASYLFLSADQLAKDSVRQRNLYAHARIAAEIDARLSLLLASTPTSSPPG